MNSSAISADHHAKETPAAGRPRLGQAAHAANEAAEATTKLANMYITTWPPIMLPNSRIARVSGRTKKEMNSIGTSRNRQRPRHARRHEQLEEAEAVADETHDDDRQKVITASVAVTASCEVTVWKKMNRPSMFITTMKQNRAEDEREELDALLAHDRGGEVVDQAEQALAHHLQAAGHDLGG